MSKSIIQDRRGCRIDGPFAAPCDRSGIVLRHHHQPEKPALSSAVERDIR
jgi:hypothetical protein